MSRLRLADIMQAYGLGIHGSFPLIDKSVAQE